MNHYYQVLTALKNTPSFEGHWEHNYDSFDDAAQQFASEVFNLTGRFIPVPDKLNDAYFESEKAHVWIWRVPQFPFKHP